MQVGTAEPLLIGAEPQVPAERPERTLTLFPLAALIFFEVSGGPFGVEDAVGAAGPFWALLGFVVFPLIWSVPEALVTAELSGLFPENAGFVAWVTEAFGPCLGFVEGWCSWWSSAIDNAIYPALFLQYGKQLSEGTGGWLDDRVHFLIALLAINVLLTYVSWRGLDVVGRAAMMLGLVAVSPFFAMTVLAVPHLDLSRLSSRRAQPNWRLLMNTLMWNLNYWDSASTLSGEVVRPGSTMPQALAVTVIIVIVTYTVPIVIGCAHVIGADGDGSGSGSATSFLLTNGSPAAHSDDQWSNWRDGYFTTVAEHIGGRWLGMWLLGAAALSAMGQYLAEMSSNSFQLEGMAQRNQLPHALRFGRRSRHGTSTTGIFASFLMCIILGVVEVDAVIEATNFVYCVAALLEFAAFLSLRRTAVTRNLTSSSVNESERSVGDTAVEERFVIPLGTIGCTLMLLPAAGSIVMVVCLARPVTMLLGACVVMTGPFVYLLGAKL